MKAATTPIEGVLTQKLPIFATGNGDVLRMLRPDSPLLPSFREGFGEIYFSEVRPAPAPPKAWKRHRRQTQLFAVPMGLIKIVLFDGRPDSPSRGVLLETFLGRPSHYELLKIPPGIWYGFQALESMALICNCADMPHDPAEGEKLDFASSLIGYRW